MAVERRPPKPAGLDVFEAIWTTRAMRRLDTSRPVSDADLKLILEAASMAPSGGNSQPVRWLVVRDAELRRHLGEIYGPIARRTFLGNYAEAAQTDPAIARLLDSAMHLADHLGEAPVLLIPCAPKARVRIEGAVFPAIQNLMLAARALGLGTTLTSVHRDDEEPVKRLLGIPDDIQTYAIIPVGHPLGRWAVPARVPVEEVCYSDRWGEPLK
jgi:nitroreductase